MDGGSTDGTVELLEKYREKITYFESVPDRGIAHAWNKGLRKCRGDWLIFLGADDRLHDENVLADMAAFLQRDTESDLVYGQIVFSDGCYTGKTLGQPFDWNIYKRRMSITHTGCFQRRCLFEEIGDFDEAFKIAVDYEIFLRKPSLKAEFVPRLITTMGGRGVSTQQTRHSLQEGRLAQIKNRVDWKIKIEIWHAFYQLRYALEKMLVVTK